MEQGRGPLANEAALERERERARRSPYPPPLAAPFPSHLPPTGPRPDDPSLRLLKVLFFNWNDGLGSRAVGELAAASLRLRYAGPPPPPLPNRALARWMRSRFEGLMSEGSAWRQLCRGRRTSSLWHQLRWGDVLLSRKRWRRLAQGTALPQACAAACAHGSLDCGLGLPPLLCIRHRRVDRACQSMSS